MALVGLGAKNSFRGYAPRVKRSKPQRTTDGKPGLGGGRAKPNKASPAWGKLAKPGLGEAPAKQPVGQKPEFDQSYHDTVDLVNRQEQSSLSQLDKAGDKTKFNFGIGDPTNPFSRANGLKRAYLSKLKGQSASLASQGQLYSGAHERALSRTRREQEQSFAELRSAFDDAMGQIDQAKGNVQFQSEADRIRAFESWLARAPEADVPVSDPEPAAAAGPSGPPSPTPMPQRTGGISPSAPAAQQILNPFGGRGPAKGVKRGGKRGGKSRRGIQGYTNRKRGR